MTYTSHGHHIPGTSRDDELGRVNRHRCGGVPLCTTCVKETEIYFLNHDGDIFEDKQVYSDELSAIDKAKLFVIGAYNNSVEDEENQLATDELHVVWYNYTLGNWKVLFCTNRPEAGLYFEVTHNHVAEATYVDTYLKIANDEFSPEGNDA